MYGLCVILHNSLSCSGKCQLNVSTYIVSVTGAIMVPVAQQIRGRWRTTECLRLAKEFCSLIDLTLVCHQSLMTYRKRN